MLEDGKKLFDRLTGGKKLRKDQWMIVILVGVLLCVISLPVEKSETKSGISDNINDRISNHTESYENTSGEDYVEAWERKLEESLTTGYE